jgi:hypothetical protein
VQHTIGKLSTKVITLLETSSQSKVCTQSYGAPKSRESQLWEFWDSHLGVPGQKTIWMWALWRSIKYNIKGKVVASPKSGPWWVLWVRGCPSFVLAPKVLQLCIDQLVVWYFAGSCEWLSASHSSPISKLQHALLPPKYCEPGGVPQLLTFSLSSF